jgi:hypothetical protein
MCDGAKPWSRSTRPTSVRGMLLAFAVLPLFAHQLAGFPQRLAFTAPVRGLYTREAAARGIVLRAGHFRGPTTRKLSSDVMSSVFLRPLACPPFCGSCLALRARADQDGAEAEGDLSRPLAAGDYARVLDDAPGWVVKTTFL